MAFIGDNACGAWVNINGNNQSVRDDHNVNTVTYHGNGDYTINFESGTFSNSNYCVVLGSSSGHGRVPHIRTNNNNDTGTSGYSFSTYSTSGCRLVMNGTHGGTSFSGARSHGFMAAFFGDA